jgi:hypothetical protein
MPTSSPGRDVVSLLLNVLTDPKRRSGRSESGVERVMDRQQDSHATPRHRV